MTEGAPRRAPRRPATARPRSDQEQDGTAPPTQAELDAIESQQIAWAALQGAEIVDDPYLGAVLIRHPDPGPGFNLAVRLRWSEDDATERLAELEHLMRSADRWPSLIVSEGLTQPPDLEQRLHAAGWARLAAERIMFTRHAPVVPHLDPGLRVEAVTPASALEMVRLETAVFGLLELTIGERAERLAHAVESSAVRGFLVRLGNEAIATARLVPGPGVAGLHGIGVGARHRRRGYGRMVTAVATRAGLVTGRGLVWLSVDEANSAAVDMYRSLGYETSFGWSRWAAPDR